MENKINIGVWISLLIIIIPSSRERDFTFCLWMLSKSWIPKLRHNHTGHALVRTYTYYCPTFIYAQEQAGCKFTMKFGSNFQRDPHLSRLCSHQATECVGDSMYNIHCYWCTKLALPAMGKSETISPDEDARRDSIVVLRGWCAKFNLLVDGIVSRLFIEVVAC